MVRQLKYHEQKLLKKVDFLNVSSISHHAANNRGDDGLRDSGSKMRTCARSK